MVVTTPPSFTSRIGPHDRRLNNPATGTADMPALASSAVRPISVAILEVEAQVRRMFELAVQSGRGLALAFSAQTVLEAKALAASHAAQVYLVLSEVYFSPVAPIEAQWSHHNFWQVPSVQITSAITLDLGVIALLAWSLRGFDTAYGYFGAAALMWGARNSHFLLTEMPVRVFYWAIFSNTAQIWVLSLVFMFVLRFAGRVRSALEKLIWAFFDRSAVHNVDRRPTARDTRQQSALRGSAFYGCVHFEGDD